MVLDESNEQHGPEIHVDDEWKNRVKAEDAALDQARESSDQSKNKSTPTADAADAQQLPPADFMTLVSTFTTPAMIGLGLIPNPATEKSEVNLDLAKHSVDLLGVLEDKTSGNLSAEEETFLQTALHQFRLAYIERTKAST